MERVQNSVTWKIGGAAGEGIMVTGMLFSRSCVAGGLKAFDYTEYPSLIRGGHNTYLTQVSENPIFSHDRSVELLVVLNQETLQKHIGEITPGGAVFFDPEDKTVIIKGLRKDVLFIPVAFSRIAKDIAGNLLMRNTVALGASFGLLEYPTGVVEGVIKKVFGSKGDAVVQQNIDVFRAGYSSVTESQKKRFGWKLEKREPKGDILIAGNDALSIGAIAAGCKFYSAYPMTPASSILTYLAEHAKQFGMVVKHAEDEISVINMAIGAGHMGVRSMCGTSGGGFSLMVEGYGMAAMTETPLVIVLAQRPGPSTGLPTWTGQGDLKFALNASQGDFPRFVMAVSDVQDCFYGIADAFNVAEKYQTPVIVITDKHLAECHQTTEPFDQSKITFERGKIVDEKKIAQGDDFKRYDVTAKDGISARSFPGMKGGIYVANSDEHDEYGYSVEDAEPVIAMFDKRWKKLEAFKKVMPQPAVEGNEDADVTFVCWGSTKGAVKEAVKMLGKKKISANYLNVTWIAPFPVEAVKNALKNAKRAVLVEANQNGQLGDVIAEQTGFFFKEKILKYDGRPFFPEEIVEFVSKKRNGNR